MKLLKQLSVVFLGVAVIVFAVALFFQFGKSKKGGPVISMDSESIEMSISDPEEMMLSGVQAQDPEDGDVSSSLVIESISMGAETKERVVTIAAFDSDNNVTKATRTVTYVDYTLPTFTLSRPLSFATGTSISGISHTIYAQDPIDGDITKRIRYYNAEGSEFNTNVPGNYSVVFSVSNDVGLVEEFTATVEMYDKNEKWPATIMLRKGIEYLPRGAAFDPKEYIYSVTVGNEVYQYQDGELISQNDEDETFEDVQINNPVDTNVPGWYEVSYTVIYEDQPARTAYLLVRVQE